MTATRRRRSSAGRRARRAWPVVLLAALLLAGARPGPEQADDLARIEAYLNDLDSLRAAFVQVGPDGGLASGDLYYRRPNKMRLDYDPPSDLLIVANGLTLTYHDRRLGQVSRMFTSQTPLAFMLEDEIRLDGDVRVTDFRHEGGEFQISLVEADDPNEGQVTMVFGDDPVELRRWAVTDAQGLTTQVYLERVETGVPLDDELFVFRERGRFDRD